MLNIEENSDLENTGNADRILFYRSHAYRGQSKLSQQITKTSMGKALPHLKSFAC